MIRPSLAPDYRSLEFPVPRVPSAEPTSQPARPRLSRRRLVARRAVLLFAGAYVVATVGFAVALDVRLPKLRYPEYGQRAAALLQLQAQHPDRPLVVAVGSSRTQMGLDPGAMGFADRPGSPLVYNCGLVGALPVHHPLGYGRLRNAGVRPAAVVCEIFPALLGVEDATATLYADDGAGLTAAELVQLAPDMRGPRTALAWARSRVGAWGAFRREFHRQQLPRWSDPAAGATYERMWVPDGRGYRPMGDRVTDADRERGTDKALGAYVHLCRNLQVAPAAERAYRELVAACRADGVPVAFVLTPEAPLFHRCYTPTARAELTRFVRLLEVELGAPVFDQWGGWDEADFFDGHHLLSGGATKYSRRLADRHLRPWLATIFPHGDGR